MAENKRTLMTLPYDDNKREAVFCSERILSEDYAVHSHNFFEIEFLIEGEGAQIINGKEYPWHAGGLVFFSPSDFHMIRVYSPLRFYNISFDTESLSDSIVERLMDLGEHMLLSDGMERAHLEKLASMLADVTENLQSFGEEYALLLLSGFLVRLHHMADRQKYFSTQLPAIKQATLFMHERFKRKLTLAEIASAVHLSPSYLSELFSREMGITVFRYLAELRIDYAKKLLDSTGDSVTEICFSCGYTSIPNFMKDFKRITGMSPLKYKAREGSKA